jgi:hypothetical protein
VGRRKGYCYDTGEDAGTRSLPHSLCGQSCPSPSACPGASCSPRRP